MAKKAKAGSRNDTLQRGLLENEIDVDPVRQFDKWWHEAKAAGVPEADAMTLCTASADGVPSARMMVLRGHSEQGFVFFTNYESFKGRQLAGNPKACLVFFWKEMGRQVRVTGFVQRLQEKDSDDYFNTRPVTSRVSASVSPQSQIIESRQWLDEQVKQFNRRDASAIKRPMHWGGFVVIPVMIEFWQGRDGRLHDRLEYSLTDAGEWKVVRLAP